MIFTPQPWGCLRKKLWDSERPDSYFGRDQGKSSSQMLYWISADKKKKRFASSLQYRE